MAFCLLHSTRTDKTEISKQYNDYQSTLISEFVFAKY